MVAAAAPTAAGAMTIGVGAMPIAAGAMTIGVGAWATGPACMGAFAGAAASATTGAAAWAVLTPTELAEMFNAVVCKPATDTYRPHTRTYVARKYVYLSWPRG